MDLTTLSIEELMNLQHSIREELWRRSGAPDMIDSEYSLGQIPAIKAYRERTGLSLLESKRAWDRYVSFPTVS